MDSVPAAWRVVGAVAPGTAHQRVGLPCQDALAYRQTPAGVLLVALGDGAGSAERSELGSRRAVDVALQFLDDALAAGLDALAAGLDALSAGLPPDPPAWEGLLLAAFETAQAALFDLAEAECRPVRDFATTLTCLAATADCLVIGTLGDCLAVAGDEDGGLFVATQLQRGEYANETNFLSQDEAMDQVQVEWIGQSVTRLAVMSDGLIRLALSLPSQEPFLPFFQPLFQFVSGLNGNPGGQAQAEEQLAAFLASERVSARTDDDKSLLLAVRTSNEPAGMGASAAGVSQGARVFPVPAGQAPEEALE